MSKKKKAKKTTNVGNEVLADVRGSALRTTKINTGINKNS